MQRTDATCGPASVATILQNGYGLIAASEVALVTHISQIREDLRSDLEGLSKEDKLAAMAELLANIGGTSFEDLKLAVQKFGMTAVGFEVTLDQLRKLQTWAIVHLPNTKEKHFAVLSGMNSSMVELRDPSVGHYSLTWSAFAHKFLYDQDQTGKVLLIIPDSVDPLGEGNMPQLSEKQVPFQIALATWGRIP